MSKFNVGDRVVLKKEQEAYYSGYAGNPIVIVPAAGAVGVVGSVDVPCTYHRKGEPLRFNCVDFVLPGVFAGNPARGNCKWRCGVFEKEMKKV